MAAVLWRSIVFHKIVFYNENTVGNFLIYSLIGLSMPSPILANKLAVPGYWDREFSASVQYSIMYNVGVKIEDTPGQLEKVERIFKEAGCSRQPGYNQNYYGNRSSGDLRTIRAATCTMAVDAAAKMARRIANLGEIQNFSVQPQNLEENLRQIEEMIVPLLKESGDNEACLKKMPIASLFLRNKLDRLKQAKASHETARKTAIVSVQIYATAAP